MSRLSTATVWVGGAALLAATLIDTVAVIGRNVGWPMLGSIEFVQAAVLVSGVVGLVIATAAGEHARVRLLTDRFRSGRAFARVLNALASASFYALLLVGCGWLAIDMWPGQERSEVLGVPWAALRFIANFGLIACFVLSLVRLRRRPRS